MSTVLWTPSATAIREANLTRFREFAARRFGAPPGDDYDALHCWSLVERGRFWTAVWEFADVIGDLSPTAYVPGPHMTDARWFSGGTLNFAENLLRPSTADDSTALIFRNEFGEEVGLTRKQLLDRTTAFAEFLRQQGVSAGDRVAAVIPNIPEAVIAMLGTTAIGAVWSSCSPDFGDDAICDRFGQIEPAVLAIAANASYNGKAIALSDRVRAVLPRLPSVRAVVVAGGGPMEPLDDRPAFAFEAVTASPPPSFAFVRLPFDHPLYILYSSGTTGAPKCIVHGAGGTLLQHLKEHQLHSDLKPGDRLFYFTTTGWMMWNWLVTGLASKATIVLYDGSPFYPDGKVLWDLAARHRVTHFGASAKYLAHLEQQGLKPRETHDLTALRVIFSTGSPLLPESFDFVYRDIKPDVCLASISGGTDIISCFALGCPSRPVHRGELQVKGLGMDVQVFNEEGKPVVGEPGELVCASPFPSMPVGFWNDPGKEKYLNSYFRVFDNVWCHGDWAEETATGGLIIHGRSDTTLNPGGVRIGTAELYQQVETFPEIAEALATALRRGGDEQIMLFVRMRPGHALDETLIAAIKHRLRSRCSPRHVPAFVIAAPDFPRTISGKLSEVAVRNAINGQPVKNTAALANPHALDFFRSLPELRPAS
jgi:acetoacetyl-CoA synthetase